MLTKGEVQIHYNVALQIINGDDGFNSCRFV